MRVRKVLLILPLALLIFLPIAAWNNYATLGSFVGNIHLLKTPLDWVVKVSVKPWTFLRKIGY